LYSGKRGAKDKTGRLGIALRRGYESDAFLGSLVTVINNWLSENRDNSVTLFNFCTFDSVKQDDRPLSLKLKGKLAAEYCSRTDVIDYRGNLIEFSDSLLGCALLISVRLHASVLAYTLNIPFVMISYDEKCLDFAREISLKRQYLFLYQDITQGDDVLIKAVADLSMTDLTKNTISVKPLSDVKKPLLDSLLNTSKYLDS
jgi:polysaccharide pyruvyl transferase WcaK-like protein